MRVNLAITTTDVSTPENADKVINLTANKGGADFFIAGGADENKFSLSGTTLTFKATDFEARDDKTYSVEIAANRAIGSKINHFICIFWRRNISRGNGKIRLYRYGKFLGITITCWITNMNLKTIKPTRWRLLPIEQALTVELSLPPKPLLLRLPI
jgi:hypothetical protein